MNQKIQTILRKYNAEKTDSIKLLHLSEIKKECDNFLKQEMKKLGVK